jgi:hypothetical protein
MSKFLQEVGGFFSELGTGVTTTVQGFGSNLGSQANLNNAQAEAIMAAARTTEQRLFLEAEQQKRQQNLILFIVAAIVFVPLAGMAIFYGLKK